MQNPLFHRATGLRVLGRHREEEGLPFLEHRHGLLHQADRVLAVDRQAAEPSHQGTEGPRKSSILPMKRTSRRSAKTTAIPIENPSSRNAAL